MAAKFTEAENEVGEADAAQRRKMPASWFLVPAQRKYPSHDSAGKPSRALLTHAEERATRNNHPDIAKRAREMLARHFPEAGSKGGVKGISVNLSESREAPVRRKRRWI